MNWGDSKRIERFVRRGSTKLSNIPLELLETPKAN